jgi:hypothetical protein
MMGQAQQKGRAVLVIEDDAQLRSLTGPTRSLNLLTFQAMKQAGEL